MKTLKNIGVLVGTGAFAILGMVLSTLALKPESVKITKNTNEESK